MYTIKKFVVGALQSNSYLLWNEKEEALLFDIGAKEIDEIRDFIRDNNLELKAIFLTHGHIDHIAGINNIMRAYPKAEVYIGKNESEYLTNSEYNLSYHIFREMFKVEDLSRITYVKDGDKFWGMEVIDTPGHTKGGVCYYNRETKILISGDTLFNGSMGRTDFIGGNSEFLFKSLEKLCESLPADTKVYSGHGSKTTIGVEKENLFVNYYDEY